MAALFSITGYLGINFVLVLVRSFGALMAVTGGVHVHVYTELLRIFCTTNGSLACMIPAKCIHVRNSKLKPVASKR